MPLEGIPLNTRLSGALFSTRLTGTLFSPRALRDKFLHEIILLQEAQENYF